MIPIETRAIFFALLLIPFLSCSKQQEGEKTESTEQVELPSDGFEIADAWARPGREGGVSAIYMNILNGSSATDTLVSISSPVAGMAEVHETYKQEDGMMGMRPVKTVVAPPRSALSLKPGGLHVMLMQINRELKEGDTIEFTVTFANNGERTLTAPVKSMRRQL